MSALPFNSQRIWRSALQAALLFAVLWTAWHVFDWAVLKAVFLPDVASCQALDHRGACWGVVAAKWQTWVFGRYPLEEQWRPALALALWAGALGLGLAPLWWSGLSAPAGRWLTLLAAGLFGVGMALMAGGWGGLPAVESAQWSGLPLTVLLTVISLGASMPLAFVLAWGRLSRRRWWSWPATAVIEVVRGAPLIMWLFMAAFLLPALLPASWAVGPVGRVLIVTTVFSAAYAAEILRGSLRIVAHEQSEAAQVLGANWWTAQSRVIVPQALRAALPSLVSHAIGLLKDTALVMVISLQDFTGAMAMSLNGDADWRPFFLEAYLVIAAVYATLCMGMATIGRRLESHYPALGYRQ